MSEFNPLGLVDRAALEHFRQKKLLPGFSHWDVWMTEHATAFTVAKMMNEDMLADVKSVIERALEAGMPFAEFKKNLKPYLMIRGWWGEQVMTDPLDGKPRLVQLGSTRRLKTIYQTNMHTAFAAGQWARVQANKKALPYLRYNGSAAAHPREGHRRYYGLILPVDHVLWRYIFPPNGYGCKCTVSQLSRQQAEREGVSPQPDIRFVEVTNPRTGEVVRIPPDITPTFAHNHSDRLGAVKALYADKYGKTALEKLETDLDQYLTLRGKPDIFKSSESIIAEGKKLFERYRDTITDAFDADKPHEAVLEIMRNEGVGFGGEVAVYGSSEETVKEFSALINRTYPKAWIEKSNAIGRVLTEDSLKRAWHLEVKDDIENIIEMFRKKQYPEGYGYERFRWAFIGRKPVFRKGDSLLLNNLKKSKMSIDSTQIHEFAHRLQSSMPELDEYFTRLWKERTKGEAVKTMREMTGNDGYGLQEKGKRDDFPSPYYGKMYGDEDDPQPKEMMSMIFESLLGGDPKRFKELAAKPDFMYFGLALLTRYKP